ncbi:MAG: hypothetical protein ABSB73_07895 [Solirubrobacteraceae bacterium]
MSALTLVALASSAGAAPASCAPPASKTLRASGAARIYSVGSELFACLGARRTALGTLRGTVASPARRVVLYTLNRRYAAVDTVEMGVDTLASTVTLFDLSTATALASAPATTPARAAESFVSVTELAVNATGTLAWIGRRSAVGTSTAVYELHVLTAHHETLIATGTGVIDSMIVKPTTLSWRFGSGPRRSISLAPPL